MITQKWFKLTSDKVITETPPIEIPKFTKEKSQ